MCPAALATCLGCDIVTTCQFVTSPLIGANLQHCDQNSQLGQTTACQLVLSQSFSSSLPPGLKVVILDCYSAMRVHSHDCSPVSHVLSGVTVVLLEAVQPSNLLILCLAAGAEAGA